MSADNEVLNAVKEGFRPFGAPRARGKKGGKPPLAAPGNEKGFTATELLVVIFTAAAGALLFFSALSRAGEQDAVLSCRNNLKGVYEAAMKYVNDFEAISTSYNNAVMDYMRLLTGTSDFGGRTEYLSPDTRVFFCPLRSDEIPPTLWSGEYWMAGYPVNIADCVNGWMRISTVPREGRPDMTVYTMTPRRSLNPANHWFFSESHNSTSGRPRSQLHSHHQTGVHSGFHVTAIHLLHGETANMMFLDGHVESVDPPRLKDVDDVINPISGNLMPFGQYFDMERERHAF